MHWNFQQLLAQTGWVPPGYEVETINKCQYFTSISLGFSLTESKRHCSTFDKYLLMHDNSFIVSFEGYWDCRSRLPLKLTMNEIESALTILKHVKKTIELSPKCFNKMWYSPQQPISSKCYGLTYVSLQLLLMLTLTPPPSRTLFRQPWQLFVHIIAFPQ